MQAKEKIEAAGGKISASVSAKTSYLVNNDTTSISSKNKKAKELNIVLGVEGRSHFEQVPGEWEMPRLMAEFAENPHVRYWHDFGHIQRKQPIPLDTIM